MTTFIHFKMIQQYDIIVVTLNHIINCCLWMCLFIMKALLVSLFFPHTVFCDTDHYNISL